MAKGKRITTHDSPGVHPFLGWIDLLAPFTGLSAVAVLGPPFTAGAQSVWLLEARSRAFSLFDLSRWLKPNREKPRERG